MCLCRYTHTHTHTHTHTRVAHSIKETCLQCRRPEFNPWVGKISWRKEWISTPVFLPGKFHEQRSLVGDSPWDHKELDTTEGLQHIHTHAHIYFNTSISLLIFDYIFGQSFPILDMILEQAAAVAAAKSLQLQAGGLKKKKARIIHPIPDSLNQ